MKQELELSENTTIHQLQGTETNKDGTEQSGVTPSERRLLRIVILTLGLLCIAQAILNTSLRLAFHSKEDADQFPFNSSVIADMCQIDQSPQNSTQSCFCCKNLLRMLLKKCRALETETEYIPQTENDLEESGSGI